MSTFVKGGGAKTPFGRNEFLRSTDPRPRTTSYTLASTSWPQVLIDGTYQKIAQPGTVLAKITSGADSGKVGPYSGTAGTREAQTFTKVGTISGGTFTIAFQGAVTAPLAFDITAAALQTALNGLFTVAAAGGVTVTGGPINTGAFTVTFNLGGNQVAFVKDATLLTGSTPDITVAESVAGVAGAVDGRQTAANIVGLLMTFLPWQLLERDVEVSVVYEASVVQAWCLELSSNGQTFSALSNTTADLMKPGVLRGLGLLFT
jgi:hypothetical protein